MPRRERQHQLQVESLGLDPALSQQASILQKSGGQLLRGWPHPVAKLPAVRLTWWPRGVPQLQTTGLVSSRLGRELDRKDDFFRVLRSACAQLDPRRQMLLCCDGTTTFRFLLRAARLFGLSVLKIVTANPRQTMAAWLDEQTKYNEQLDDSVWPCFLSPALAGEKDQGLEADAARAEFPDGLPLRDNVAIHCCDQLVVLHLRKGGNLAKLLEDRLSLAAGKSPSVYLALGSEQLVPTGLATSLMEQGAVGWLLMDQEAPTSKNHPSRAPFGTRQSIRPAAVVPPPLEESWSYLTHCTRRTRGQWPNQTEEDFLDELILGAPSRDRSSLSTLMKIISSRRLLASNVSIRGGSEVVSFSEANFSELATMRTFRAHRGRWDFEPYGICIENQVLQSLGTRRVVYGDDTLWQRLSVEERPFFQKAVADGGGIDWMIEREWRHLGDIDLSRVPRTSGLVFVPSEAEANHVAQISPWPVTVVHW